MADKLRVPLYERVPELYRIEDAKQTPAQPLRAFLGLVEDAFAAVHESIESLYHDLFIDTCDEWVIPYLADLLGTSHLKGDPRTLRRDIAGTIGWRRRKGTLGVIEALTEALSGWGVHAAEMFKDLVWAQELDHQRPDAGGQPPYGLATVDRHTVVRGGTAVIRDPATLALLATPFNPFAHLPDFRAPCFGSLRINLPNLAVFLWRLEAYRVGPATPVHRGTVTTGLGGELAQRVLRFDLHPLGQAVQLFNVGKLENGHPPLVTAADLKPGPIHPARLDSMRPPFHRSRTEPPSPGVGELWLEPDGGTWREWDGSRWRVLEELVVEELVGGGYGKPEAYVTLVAYDPDDGPPRRASDLALELHLPEAPFSPFDATAWRFRGADLLGWEEGLRHPLRDKEIAIDPRIGRLAIGVRSTGQAEQVSEHLRVVYTYGAVGPVGAHPVDRPPTPAGARMVDGTPGSDIEDALGDLHTAGAPVVVEIADDEVHDLDLDAVAGAVNEAGGPTLRLAHSLTVRAADGKRPIVRLVRPLRLRALDAARAGSIEVRLEGLYLTRGAGWTAGDPLLARADVASLVLAGCTLDPGGAFGPCHASGRSPIHPGVRLRDQDRVVTAGNVAQEIQPTVPEVHLLRTVTGPLRIDRGYRLFLTESILDAGSGVNEDPATAGYALSGAGEPPHVVWGPEVRVESVTFFGRVRVERASGKGGIWTQPCEVLDNQKGCIKHSYFTGRGDRLPQTHACVRGSAADAASLRFVSEAFGRPEYGQLAFASDFRIRERGPKDDAMGAFGFLLAAHKWHNIEIRYREFMPVGIRPLLIPVT